MKAMPIVEEREHAENNAAFFRDAKLESLSAISDATCQILQNFQDAIFVVDSTFRDAKQDSVLALKQEREQIKTELRECLAQNKSLRRKDFDNMMQGILSMQDEQEKEGRHLLNNYLMAQKNMSDALREHLAKFKDSLIKGEIERGKEFQKIIKEILDRQEERRNEVASMLKEFQEEQQEMVKKLRELLGKGKDLRIKDFKAMLKEFAMLHKERITHREERREEVQRMLSNFKNKRKASIRHSPIK